MIRVFLAFFLSAHALAGALLQPGSDSGLALSGKVPACVVRDGAPLSARSRAILFPDGRELTVVGHNHGTREIANGPIESLKRLSLFRGDVSAFRSEVLKTLADDPTASGDAADDVASLRELLKSPNLKLVAVEASAETVATNLKSYAQIRRGFLAEISRRRLHDETSNIQAFAFGADFFLRLSEPALFTRRSFIGVEDANLGHAYESALKTLSQTSARVARATFDPLVAPVVNSFLNALPTRYQSYRPEVDDAAILKEARRLFTASDAAKIDPYLRAQLAVMRAMKARDRHDVDQLLGELLDKRLKPSATTKSSGVMFIGSSHLDSVMSLLRERCELLLRATTAAVRTHTTGCEQRGRDKCNYEEARAN